MKRIYLTTQGPSDWRGRLADPGKHWKRERSAFELAVSWELARFEEDGIPPEISRALADEPALKGAELLFGAVEHKVPLPGGSASSVNDLWAVLKVESGLISMAVEGKAGETFGDTLDKWLEGVNEKSGKPERLSYLKDLLQLDTGFSGKLRYQLLHRTASAIIEAKRIGAKHAVMMVQSFCDDPRSFGDFELFGKEMGCCVKKESVVQVGRDFGIKLYLGWVSSEFASDKQVARTVDAG